MPQPEEPIILYFEEAQLPLDSGSGGSGGVGYTNLIKHYRVCFSLLEPLIGHWVGVLALASLCPERLRAGLRLRLRGVGRAASIDLNHLAHFSVGRVRNPLSPPTRL